MKQHIRSSRSGYGLNPRVNHRMEVNKREISALQRKLLELMQEVNFGLIKGLVVKDGEPVFDPPPRVVREIKLGGENGPRHELGSDDFALKSKVAEFFEHLSRLSNGTVESIEIKHGLPFLMNIEETIRV